MQSTNARGPWHERRHARDAKRPTGSRDFGYDVPYPFGTGYTSHPIHFAEIFGCAEPV
jgi:hypothetical protein